MGYVDVLGSHVLESSLQNTTTKCQNIIQLIAHLKLIQKKDRQIIL